MITLLPTRLHWIKDEGCDDQFDLCAHSPVRFEINGETLVRPDDGDCTVSASVIYLLRTLERDHTTASPVGEHLFPCCGHAMYDTGDEDVTICGCPNGSDVEVVHVDGSVQITHTDGRKFLVPEFEWRSAVYGFADQVDGFYKASSEKKPADDSDSNGYNRMKLEWGRRRRDA